MAVYRGTFFVLWIDSDPQSRALAEVVLKRFPSRVQFAAVADEAMEILATDQSAGLLPDIIFLSWRPELSHFVAALKAEFRLRSIPLVVFVGRPEADGFVNEIYDLDANAVVCSVNGSGDKEEALMATCRFWFQTAAVLHR